MPADLAAVPAEARTRLLSARHVVTICHENPEADALGSALALALALESLGAVATPVCADPVPELYGFMPAIERFRTTPDPAADYDLVVVLDCGELARVGPVLETHAGLFARVPIVNIDHHKSNPGFGAVNWIDAQAAATCEMVTLLLGAMGVPLTTAGGAVADSLLAGLVMDTATFQHPNVTPRTLRVGADLVAAGAPLSTTSRLLYRTKPDVQLKLFGRVLARLESELDGRLVWSTLTLDDLASTGGVAAYSEGIIDLLGQAQAAELVLLLKEQPGETRVSIRTRDGGPDATVLAARWGGGGHVRASGATVRLPLDAAVREVLEAARRLLQSPESLP
ncbi:MAG TPA: DHH family phosphoesterase [Candidatus Acidoferrales bacterium]|nr:DHH family phosphoesterase [Candidatus Acidoferrales bacterium]